MYLPNAAAFELKWVEVRQSRPVPHEEQNSGRQILSREGA